MSKKDKQIIRLISKPKDYKYAELTSVLKQLGYIEIKSGKTAGSRRAFINKETKHIIRLHKPHPKEILKIYQLDYIINELKKEKLL